ncbi:MAG: 6-phosphofructokinase [Caldisericia bacterium]
MNDRGLGGMMNADYIELTKKRNSRHHEPGRNNPGTSRTNPHKHEGGAIRVKETFENLKLDGLLTAGGDDTLGVSAKLCDIGLPIVGIPKTMDNDLVGTDFTFGFDSACNCRNRCNDEA